MPEQKHNYRWRYPSGRVSWTYVSREMAVAAFPNLALADRLVLTLEQSEDNGLTWKEAENA